VGPSLLLRSILFVPGTRPERFAKAIASGADAVVLDLEDAVEPTRKAEAREHIGQFVAGLGPDTRAAVLVRINAPGSPWIDDDVDWMRGIGTFVDAVVLPKVEIAAAIEGVADATPERRVLPLIETAPGVLNAGEILRADTEIPAVLFGAEDLTAELGIPRTLGGEELLYARCQVVIAAATIGADPIDAVWVHLTDTEGLRKDAERAKALGFRGKMAIHPDQVRTINDVFSPTADEIAAARKLVEADDEARAGGFGVFKLDEQMVDAPIIRRARKTLELAERSTHN
jgi:citrate lyase subunit beta/citryl-CoA lyase